jgi:hypothetical protein
MRSPSTSAFRAPASWLLVALAATTGADAARAQATPAPPDTGAVAIAAFPIDDDPIPVPRFHGGVRLASDYLFLGRDLSGGRAVAQPWVRVDHERFSGLLWADQPDGRDVPDEMRMSFEYAIPLESVAAVTGYTYRRFPHRSGWLPTQEVFATMGARTLPLAPSVSVHFDFDAGRGLYADLGLSRSLAPRLAVGTHVYVEKSYFGATGIPAIELSAASTLQFGALAVSPALSRIVTWSHGDYRGDQAVEGRWQLALDVSR